MRRDLLIAAIVLVALGVGVAVYFYFSQRPSKVTVTPTVTARFSTAGQASTTTSQNTGVSTTTEPVSTPVAVTARLVQITTGPVVPGEVVLDQKAVNASSSPDVAVRYIDRQSGNVYSYLMQAKTLTRISNKTIPGIQSASWLPNGSLAFVRYLSGTDFSTINTYALPSNGSPGYFLSQNLASIAVSSSSVLMLASGVSGSVASLARIDGTGITPVFTSPLSALQVSFAGRGQYLATTKASGSLLGDSFLIGSTGQFSRVAGPLLGLVALASPSGKWLLVSSTRNETMSMSLVNTSTGESLTLPIATIADKCVWTADESSIFCGIPVDPPTNVTYPDDWYQGAVSFSDRIWKIHVAGRYAELVLNFSKEIDGFLDATSLALDSSNSTLVFINKNGGSLWSFSL
jgi:hypothetical protein